MSMNKNQNLAEKITTGIRIFLNILSMIFPGITATIFAAAEKDANIVISNPLLLAIYVIPVAIFSLFSFKKPKFATVCSIFHLVFSELILDYSFEYMNRRIEAGNNIYEVVFGMILTLGILFFGLLFAYISTSNANVISSFILAFRAKSSYDEYIKAEKDLNNTERRHFSKCLIKPSSDDINKKRELLQAKKDKYFEIIKRNGSPLIDLFIISAIAALNITMVFLVITCLIYIFGSGNAIAEFIKDGRMCNAVFMLIEVVVIVVGFIFRNVIKDIIKDMK